MKWRELEWRSQEANEAIVGVGYAFTDHKNRRLERRFRHTRRTTILDKETGTRRTLVAIFSGHDKSIYSALRKRLFVREE